MSKWAGINLDMAGDSGNKIIKNFRFENLSGDDRPVEAEYDSNYHKGYIYFDDDNGWLKYGKEGSTHFHFLADFDSAHALANKTLQAVVMQSINTTGSEAIIQDLTSVNSPTDKLASVAAIKSWINTGFIPYGGNEDDVWVSDGAGGGSYQSKAPDADKFDGLDSSRFIYGDNERGTTSELIDLNNIAKSGFYYSNGATNSLNDSNAFVISSMFSTNDTFASQIAINSLTTGIGFRRKSNSVWGSWVELIHESNLGDFLDIENVAYTDVDNQFTAAQTIGGIFLSANTSVPLLRFLNSEGVKSFQMFYSDSSNYTDVRVWDTVDNSQYTSFLRFQYGENLKVFTALQLTILDQATSDTDQFLVSDNGTVKYVTGDTLFDYIMPDNLAYTDVTNVFTEAQQINGTEEIVTDKNKTQIYLKDIAANYLIHQSDVWDGSNWVSTHNYGFGRKALQNNTGLNTNGIGFYSLQNNTGGNSNGLGYFSLRFNSATNSNGFGFYALLNNLGGNSNGFGNYTLRFNTGIANTALGHSALSGYVLDDTNALTVESVDNTTNQVTITAHGFTGYVNLSASTDGTLPSGLSSGVNQWEVIDANTLQCRSDSFTDNGSGTLTLTPLITYNNSTALGANSMPTASNQVMLGDTNVTEVYTYGKLTAGTIEAISSNTDKFLMSDGGTIKYATSEQLGEWIDPVGVNYWTKDGSDIYYNDGNVGIGTDNPTVKLHIDSGINPNILKLTSDATDTDPGLFLKSTNSNSTWGILVQRNYGSLTIKDSDSGTFPVHIAKGVPSYSFVINTVGNVSIGSNDSEGYKLKVAGTSFFTDSVTIGTESTPADLYVNGNIYMGGEVQYVDATHVTTNNDLIELRDQAASAILPNYISGLSVENYDGNGIHTNLGVDNQGFWKVGEQYTDIVYTGDGGFEEGETITGDQGGSGVVIQDDTDNNTLRVSFVNTAFVVSEVITGSNSGASATLSSQSNVDNLQILATRAESITNDHLVYFDSTLNEFVDSGIDYNDLVIGGQAIADNQVAVGTGSGIEGSDNLTFNGDAFTVDGYIRVLFPNLLFRTSTDYAVIEQTKGDRIYIRGGYNSEYSGGDIILGDQWTGNILIGTVSDNGSGKLQVEGNATFSGKATAGADATVDADLVRLGQIKDGINDLNFTYTAKDIKFFYTGYKPSNMPTNTPSNYYTGINFRHNVGSDFAWQIVAGSADDEYYLRSNYNGVWNEWRTILHTGNFSSKLYENLTDGYLPNYNSATGKLENSPIYTNGSNVVIGTAVGLGDKLEVGGNVTLNGSIKTIAGSHKIDIGTISGSWARGFSIETSGTNIFNFGFFGSSGSSVSMAYIGAAYNDYVARFNVDKSVDFATSVNAESYKLSSDNLNLSFLTDTNLGANGQVATPDGSGGVEWVDLISLPGNGGSKYKTIATAANSGTITQTEHGFAASDKLNVSFVYDDGSTRSDFYGAEFQINNTTGNITWQSGNSFKGYIIINRSTTAVS